MWYLNPRTLRSKDHIGEPPGETGVDEEASRRRLRLKLVKIHHGYSPVWLKIELKVPCHIPFFIESLPEPRQLRDEQVPINTL